MAPLEVENCLLGHPAVAECAVVGHDEAGLTLPVACRPRRAGEGSLAASLQQHVRGELLAHKVPREVRFVSELPKTASGKLDRRALSDRREVVV